MYRDCYHADDDHPFPLRPLLLAVGVGLLGWAVGIVCGCLWATREEG